MHNIAHFCFLIVFHWLHFVQNCRFWSTLDTGPTKIHDRQQKTCFLQNAQHFLSVYCPKLSFFLPWTRMETGWYGTKTKLNKWKVPGSNFRGGDICSDHPSISFLICTSNQKKPLFVPNVFKLASSNSEEAFQFCNLLSLIDALVLEWLFERFLGLSEFYGSLNWNLDTLSLQVAKADFKINKLSMFSLFLFKKQLKSSGI